MVLLAFLLAACDAGDSGAASVRVGYAVDGAAAVTYLDADGTIRSVDVSDAWALEVSASAGQTLVLTAESATGDDVTATITLGDAVVASRRGVSVHVEHAASDDAGETEVYGPVEALSGDRVTVAGLVFVVTPSTRLYDRDNQTVPLSTFSPGTYVEAEGYAQSDGTYRADKIKLEDPDGDDDHEDDGHGGGAGIEVHGLLQAIDATGFDVADRRFVTDDATEYLDDEGDPISRDAFRVGDLVEVEGAPRPDGLLRAEKLKLDDD